MANESYGYYQESYAYVRLRVWQSLAGLVGAYANLMIRDISIEAQNCEWYTCVFSEDLSFESLGYYISHHLEAACVNPKQQEVAI